MHGPLKRAALRPPALWPGRSRVAAVSTGRGEANLYDLSSYLIVEHMRAARSPLDASMDALRRVRENTVEARLLNARGTPNCNVSFYVVSARGEYAGVSLYANKFAVCTENGADGLGTTAQREGRPTGV